MSVGFGYDAGTQGFLASVGTSEGLTGTNLQLGGKDVTARGALPARPVSRPSGPLPARPVSPTPPVRMEPRTASPRRVGEVS